MMCSFPKHRSHLQYLQHVNQMQRALVSPERVVVAIHSPMLESRTTADGGLGAPPHPECPSEKGKKDSTKRTFQFRLQPEGTKPQRKVA